MAFATLAGSDGCDLVAGLLPLCGDGVSAFTAGATAAFNATLRRPSSVGEDEVLLIVAGAAENPSRFLS